MAPRLDTRQSQDPPLVAGGQGRSAESVIESALIVAGCAVAAAGGLLYAAFPEIVTAAVVSLVGLAIWTYAVRGHRS